jgi:hypothetical protein
MASSSGDPCRHATIPSGRFTGAVVNDVVATLVMAIMMWLAAAF